MESGYLAALRLPSFRRLWLGQLISVFGDSIIFLGMNLWVYDLTGSATAVALLNVYRLAPYILVTSVSGALADRLNRKGLLVTSDLARALIVFLLSRTEDLALIYPLWGILAIFTAIFRPTLLAVVPAVSGRAYLSALGLVRVIFNVTQIAGPGLAAFLLIRYGMETALRLDALTFLVSAAFIAAVAIPPVEPERQAAVSMTRHLSGSTSLGQTLAAAFRTFVRDVIDGARFIAGQQRLVFLIGAGMIVSLAGAFVQSGTIFYVGEALGGGEVEYGYLLTAFALGSVALLALLHRLGRRFTRERLFLFSLAASGLLLLPLALPLPLVALVGFWALLGAFESGERLLNQAFLTEMTPDQLRGRVFGSETALNHLGFLAAYPIVGAILDRFGARPGAALTGLLLLMFLAGWYLWLGRRSYEEVRQPVAAKSDGGPGS